MSYEIYKLRLNRYGNNYQERIQSEREKNFSLYLSSTVYRVEFSYMGQTYLGSLEPNKQDLSEVSAYLLTEIDLQIPNGTILFLPDQHAALNPWLIYYLEDMKASGYNRYTVIRMTKEVMWYDSESETDNESWAYFYGQNTSFQTDSRVGVQSYTLYMDDKNHYYLLMPQHEHMRKGIILNITSKSITQTFRVVGLDIQTIPGVMYVSLEPNYKTDSRPQEPEPESEASSFWFNGGL